MQVEMTYVDNFLKFIFVSSCRHCNFMASNYQPITMQDFVHLHVHTQYSLLDGQASVSALVDKAMKDGMKGIAVTDHGNMFAIKEFTNYVNKKNGGPKGEIKDLKKRIAAIEAGEVECADKDAEIADCKAKIADAEGRLFKPIIGCEMYVARRTMDKKEGKPDQSGYHLIVLAKNEKGYHNLIKLVSRAWTKGYYMRPRTDRNELEKYHEGLIICSACLGGEVPKKITQGLLAEAEEAIQWYKNLFGDDYYLEMQRHKATVPKANHEAYPLQVNVNKHLIEYSKKYNVKLICTNDVHFVNEEHAEAHDRLICLSTGKDLDDPNRMYYTKQEWMKTKAEMNELFADVPEALSNTLEILDKVEYYSIDHAPIMPTFAIPEDFGTEEGYRQKYTEKDLFDEFTQDENGNVVLSEEAAKDKIKRLGGYDKLYRIKLEADYLKKLTFDGAKKFYGDPLSPEVKERLVFELHIMKTMGFPGYFLIVQDFIAAGRNMGVSIGPGRGSAAGSAVAYCLQITKIDPIKYDLLFERFLNPDRISLPDIDIDFDDDGRGEVLRWVTEKYGQEKVAHIITYGTMATKLAIKDVARVQKLPLAESDRLAKLVPDKIPDKKLNLKNAIEYVPELQAAEASPDPLVRDTMKYAKMLEGNVRGTGVHACGTIICRDDITDWVPVSTADDKETGEKMLVTQYEGSVIEDTGLIKMDFLGLKTLSIIKEAVENIRLSKGMELDIDSISIEDPATYKLYSDGRTIGTFQFESAGMQKYLRELQPSTFEDLIAMNALYRPGPMDYIPDFIDRKHGRKPIEYDIPVMEKYLKDTYGITVYQEQVMQIFRELAGFSFGQADNVRRAMSKKKHAVMEAEREHFVHGCTEPGHECPGCVANGIPEQVANQIYDEMSSFASYAFNKSHAACYAYVAFQTAYLKCHYPSQFMAALLTSVLDNTDKVIEYSGECARLGIKVLPPDVNISNGGFTADDNGQIRFGLNAVKNVGRNLIENAVAERKEKPYTSLYDFCKRMHGSELNRRAVESLIKAGAFDCFGSNRHSMVEAVEGILKSIETDSRRNLEGQLDLFSVMSGEVQQSPQEDVYEIRPLAEYTPAELLQQEKEVSGLYLSGHPLDAYREKSARIGSHTIKDLTGEDAHVQDGEKVRIVCAVVKNRMMTTKSNSMMAFTSVEDLTGTMEVIVFPKVLDRFRDAIQENAVVVIDGRLSVREDEASKLLADSILPIDSYDPTRLDKGRPDPVKTAARRVFIRLPSRSCPQYAKVINLLGIFDGNMPVILYLEDTKQKLAAPRRLYTSGHPLFFKELERLLGAENVATK